MSNSRTHILRAAGMAIVAAGSNSQSNATQLTSQHPVKMITTVSASSRGVRMPVAINTTDSNEFALHNRTATNVKVYPATGYKVGTGATNAAYTLNANTGHLFFSDANGNWAVI